LYQRVLRRQVPIVPSNIFAIAYIVRPQNARRKMSQAKCKIANVSFYETDNQACTGRVTFCYLVHRLRELSSITLEWIASACVPKLLVESDRVYTITSLVTETGLIVFSTQYNRLSQQQLGFSFDDL